MRASVQRFSRLAFAAVAIALCFTCGLALQAVAPEKALAADGALAAGGPIGAQGSSIATATAIPLNEEVSGNLENSGTKDWYKVTLSKPGRFYLVFGGDYRSSGDWRLHLYNSSNTEIWTETYSPSNTVDHTILRTGLAAGTYYLLVENSYNAYGLNYHFTPEYAESSVWETELNNTIVSADPVKLNKKTYGNLQTSGDADWYEVTLTAAGRFYLEFGGDYRSSGAWSLRLYDEANTEIWTKTYNASNTVDHTILRTGLPAGTYYLQVANNYSIYDLNYHFMPKFKVSKVWEKERNNTIVSATRIQLGKTAYGNLQTSGDSDWYKVKLSQSGMFQLVFGGEYNTSGAWRVRLYDEANTEIWGGTHNTTNTKNAVVFESGLQAGTYYVQVDNSYSAYDLNYRLKPRIIVSIANATVTGLKAKTYTGKAIKPNPKLKLNGIVLKKGVDYKLSYSGNVNAGTATITITGKGTYVGEMTRTFKIKRAAISGATIASISKRTYAGKAFKPKPKVTFNGVKLARGTDYKLSYKANRNAGTARVIVKGKGNFTGTKVKKFKIVPASIADVSVTGLGTKKYTGKAVKPKLTLEYKGKTLEAGTDYTTKFSKNKKIGTAKVVITGKGNYTDSITKTFKIKKAPNKVIAKNVSKKFAASEYTGLLAESVSFEIAARSKWASDAIVFSKANKAGGSYIRVTSTGVVTVKKGLPSGSYKVKVKIESTAGKNYRAITKTITVRVKVA